MRITNPQTAPEQETVAPYQYEALQSVPRQRHEDPYRNVVEDLLDPVCRFGSDLRLTFVNHPYAAIHGKQPAELIGESILAAVPAEYHAQVIAHLASLNTQNPVAVDENPAHLADGSWHWFHWTNRFIEYADGTIAYQGVGHDITARKQAANAEREQRLFAESMCDSLAALTSSRNVDQVMAQILASAAAVVPSEAGSIILIENGYGRVAYCRGFSPEVTVALQQDRFAIDPLLNLHNALKHKAPYVVFDTSVAEDWIAFPLTSWIRSSIGVPIECGGQTTGLLVADSATPNYFKPADVDKLQAFAHYAGLALSNAYHTAMLEQRVAERTAELQAAKDEVEAILNHSSDAIFLVQPDLSIVHCNVVVGTLLQHHQSSCQGYSLLEFIHPGSQGRVKDGTALAMQEGRNYLLQIRACRRDGSGFDAELSISPMDKRLVCRLRDITERMKSEQQRLFYASLQESVNDAVITVDLDYKIQSWNKAAEAIYGWRAAEVIEQTTLEALQISYFGDANRATVMQILLQQGYWQGEATHLRKDGTPRTIFGSLTLLRDAQQVPFGLVAISRDITEQKRIESALNESRHFVQQLADLAPNLIYVYDIQAQRIVYTNRNITTVLGYSAQEFDNSALRIISELMHPDDAAQYPTYRQRLLAGQAGEVFSFEYRIRHQNGQWRWFLSQDKVFNWETDGTAKQVLGISVDMTEQKHTAEALRRQRDFLQSVIDHIPNIIAVKNRQGKYQLANQFAAQCIGTTQATLIGKTSSEVNPNWEAADAMHQLTEKVFSHKKPIVVPERLVGGRYYQVNFISLLGERAEDDQVLIVGSDITERKQAEVSLQQTLQKERELSDLKSGFITTTSHEFRTPLTIILSTTETLRTYRQKLTNEQIDQRLDRIASQVQHLKTLMEDVFDLSRMQERRVNFTPLPCNPAHLCLTLISEFQDHAAIARHLQSTYDADLPMADLDERLLRQILNNLISNAIKYSTDDKPIAIHMACNGDAFVLTVHDEGIGIPVADLKHLFLPFYRATNVSAIPGTGLGLSIVKEAVELHGGFITVESQVGVGTTFTIKLPVTVAHKTINKTINTEEWCG